MFYISFVIFLRFCRAEPALNNGAQLKLFFSKVEGLEKKIISLESSISKLEVSLWSYMVILYGYSDRVPLSGEKW